MNFTNRSTAVFPTKTTAALGVYKVQGGTVPAYFFPPLPTDAHLVVFHLSKAFRLDCFKTMVPLLGKSLTLQWQRDKSHSADTISHHFRVLKKVRLSDCWVGAGARLTPCSRCLRGNNSDASSVCCWVSPPAHSPSG